MSSRPSDIHWDDVFSHYPSSISRARALFDPYLDILQTDENKSKTLKTVYLTASSYCAMLDRMPLFQDNRGKWTQQKINLGRFWNPNFKTKFFFQFEQKFWRNEFFDRSFWSTENFLIAKISIWRFFYHRYFDIIACRVTTTRHSVTSWRDVWHHTMTCDEDWASHCRSSRQVEDQFSIKFFPMNRTHFFNPMASRGSIL